MNYSIKMFGKLINNKQNEKYKTRIIKRRNFRVYKS